MASPLRHRRGPRAWPTVTSPPSSPSTSPSPLPTSSPSRGDFEGHRPLAVVGRDTRISGQFLEAAVVAGLASAGVDVLLLGVLPTPGVAYLTDAPRRRPRRDALGLAQPDARQRHQVPRPRRRQARRRHRGRDRAAARRAVGPPDRRRRRPGHAVRRRRRASTPPTSSRTVDHPLAGLKVVLDCAHGAASEVGPRALRDAGAEVVAICAEPDGLNINDGCGSTHLDAAAARPCSSTAPTSASPSTATPTAAWPSTTTGSVVDGDQILAILALAMRDAGRLADDTVVATVMSNLGFVQAMQRARASACGRPRSATATCSRRCRSPASPSAASSPAT